MTSQLLPPLDIKCTSYDCENGLHCFRPTRSMVRNNKAGQCRSCGAALVDWDRVRRRDIKDAAYTFETLKFEMIRHHFWHVDIDDKAIYAAVRKGKVGLRAAAEARISRSVGPATPPFDGRQTPMFGNVLYYAQHATATCCRRCMEIWHGIPRGRELVEDEVKYFTDLIMMYIEDRLPDLSEEGKRLPRFETWRLSCKA